MSDAPARTPYLMLSELIERPELLAPPVAVIPKLAYEGRVTMLAAAEKAGKSTLMGQAAADLVNGAPFFGERLTPGAVAWIGLDEPTNDLVRRFVRCGARSGIAVFREAPKLGEWVDLLADIQPRLVVIDTITEYAGGFIEDAYRASDWQPLLKVFRVAAEASGAAFVLLHHMVRNGTRYADSRQLGAGVDVIVEMTEDKVDPTARKLSVKGRLGREDFTIQYEAERYEMLGGELPLEMRVYRAIDAEPGIGTRRLREQVYGSNPAISAAVRDLMFKGAVENRGPKNGAAYYVKNGRAQAGTPPGTATGHTVSAYGPTPGTAGHVNGHAHVPSPFKGGAGAHGGNGALVEPLEARS